MFRPLNRIATADLIGSGAGVQTGGVRGSGGRLLGSCEDRGVMRALPEDMEGPRRQLLEWGKKGEGRLSTLLLPLDCFAKSSSPSCGKLVSLRG